MNTDPGIVYKILVSVLALGMLYVLVVYFMMGGGMLP